MSVVSIAIPFVLAYIVYAWYSIDRKSMTKEELQRKRTRLLSLGCIFHQSTAVQATSGALFIVVLA